MPKDASKNVDRYKVRGGSINEYEYHQNQQETATDKKQMNTDKTAKKPTARKAAKKKSP
jgi:hypothetical protein